MFGALLSINSACKIFGSNLVVAEQVRFGQSPKRYS